MEFVEVGLYRDTNVPSELEATLVNSWMIQADQRGQYKEILTVPADADTGRYYIIATTVRQRKNLPGWVLPNGNVSLPLVYGSHTDGIDHYYAALLVIADEPVKVAKEFYEALDAGCITGDFHHAYSLLSSERKKLRTYEQLKKIVTVQASGTATLPGRGN